PTARGLHATLVERPLEWLSKLKRRDVIFLFVMVVLMLTAGEFVAIFGAGELVVLGANLSLFIDAVVVTTAVTIATAVAAAWRDASAQLSQFLGSALARRRTRAVRHGKTRKTRRPKSLDDDAPGWGLAHPA
ncbi:MAG: hypothetical protein ABL871_17070, partial [Terricaulis sp.]